MDNGKEETIHETVKILLKEIIDNQEKKKRQAFLLALVFISSNRLLRTNRGMI